MDLTLEYIEMTKSTRAWLISWQSREHESFRKVIAVLNPRLRAERVAWLMEQIYAGAEYSDYERLKWMIRPKENPYTAQYGQLRGGRFLDHTVGHEPHLFGRKVTNLRMRHEDGTEALVWDEIPLPVTTDE